MNISAEILLIPSNAGETHDSSLNTANKKPKTHDSAYREVPGKK